MKVTAKVVIAFMIVASHAGVAAAETEEEMMQRCREDCGDKGGVWGYHPCSCITAAGDVKVAGVPVGTSSSVSCKTLYAEILSNLSRQANIRALASKRQQLSVISLHIGDPARLLAMADKVERDANTNGLPGQAAQLREIARDMVAEGISSDDKSTRNDETLASARSLSASLALLADRVKDLEVREKSLRTEFAQKCQRR